MLGSKLEDLIHSRDDFLQVVVDMGWSLPLVVHLLFPGDLDEVSHDLPPLGADSEAFVELESDIGEGGLPDVALFEFSLDAAPKRLGDDAEGVLHSLL